MEVISIRWTKKKGKVAFLCVCVCVCRARGKWRAAQKPKNQNKTKQKQKQKKNARNNDDVTFHDGHNFADEGHPAGAEVLAERHFLEEDGDAAEDHGHEVGDQERTCGQGWWIHHESQS